MLAACLAASTVEAQWVPTGIPIVQSPFSEGLIRIASDGGGGAIVTFEVDRISRDIYSQRVTREGTIPPGWPGTGVAVCSDPAQQFDPQIISDGLGGAYIAWIDRRHATTIAIDHVYLQRLRSDGSLFPGWTPNGIRVCPVAGGQNFVRLAPDGLGGVYLVWDDFRRGIPNEYGSQVDLYAQHILPDGTIAPSWPVEGLPVCSAPGGRGFSRIVPDGVGGFSWPGSTVEASMATVTSMLSGSR